MPELKWHHLEQVAMTPMVFLGGSIGQGGAGGESSVC
jgi:hypothetical protein